MVRGVLRLCRAAGVEQSGLLVFPLKHHDLFVELATTYERDRLSPKSQNLQIPNLQLAPNACSKVYTQLCPPSSLDHALLGTRNRVRLPGVLLCGNPIMQLIATLMYALFLLPYTLHLQQTRITYEC